MTTLAGLDVGEMFSHDFIRNAFIAGSGIALAAGLAGYFVVLRNQVFTTDALGHVAFTGALAALAIGIDPLLGLFSGTVVSALGMGGLGGRARGRDVVIGTSFAWILGLGVLFLSIYTSRRSAANGSVGVSVLFGSIYGISGSQATLALLVGFGAALSIAVLARPLLFSSIDPDVAAARGVPVRFLGLIFLALVGVTVAEAVQAVGALLIFGLMVTPAAAAHRLTARPYVAMALASAISVLSLWSGLTFSYVFQRIPASFLVIAISFAVYSASVAFSAARRSCERAAA